MLFTSFWGLWAILGIPWLVDTSLQHVPLSPHGMHPVHVCVLISLFLRRYQSYWVKGPPYFSMTSS